MCGVIDFISKALSGILSHASLQSAQIHAMSLFARIPFCDIIFKCIQYTWHSVVFVVENLTVFVMCGLQQKGMCSRK